MPKIARQWIIEDGKVPEVVMPYISSLRGKYRLVVEDYKVTRSVRSNRYYWCYLNIISQETGDDPNNLHSYFKRQHLPPVFITVLGKEIKIPATTTKLSTAEFTIYINKIELECGVPAPNHEDLYI